MPTHQKIKSKSHLKLLNPKDERVLSYIRSYQLQAGEPPTRKEIADGLQLSNIMAAQRVVQKLQKHGLLHFKEQSKRGIELIEVECDEQDVVEIGLLGTVAAGRPIEAIARNESLKIPASMIKPGYPHFALLVTGRSMIEDHICDGDYIIVRQQQVAENGETVVALVDGEATLKRFYRVGKQIELRPANSSMEPIVVGSHQHLRILGVYAGLIRSEK